MRLTPSKYTAPYILRSASSTVYVPADANVFVTESFLQPFWTLTSVAPEMRSDPVPSRAIYAPFMVVGYPIDMVDFTYALRV